jgi:organic hydroperoxide reductase OsmC/OhrA
MLTWLALNKRAAIELKSWDAKGESVLDKTPEGIAFASFKISVRLAVPAARVDEARRLLDSAKKHCITANALKTPTALEAEVVAA